jgi:hypothetical protein
MKGKKFADFNPNEIDSQCHPPYWKYITLGCSIVAFVMIVIGVIIYKFWWNIQLFIYFQKKKYCSQQAPDYQPICNQYKMTISFMEDDEEVRDWVTTQLMLKCVDTWHISNNEIFSVDTGVLPGSSIIGSLNDAMENSDVIVPIINNAYLDSRRCQFELSLAAHLCHTKAKDGTSCTIIPIIFVLSTGTTIRDQLLILSKIPTEMHILQRMKRSEKNIVWNPKKNDLFWDELEERLRTYSIIPRNEART